MVADAFKIFCYHQQVERVFSVCGSLGYHVYKRTLDFEEIIVHRVVVRYRLLSNAHISFYECVNAFGHHAYGCFRHKTNGFAVNARLFVYKGDYFRDVRRLISYSFKVGYHFQRRRNLTQVSCHGLLLKQHFQAKRFYISFFLIYFRFERLHFRRRLFVRRCQRFCRVGYCLFAERAHLYKFFVQRCQLFVESASHYPNLPVM